MKCPAILKSAILADDAESAAVMSCVLAERGFYLPVLDGPRMTRSDWQMEATRRYDALARASPLKTYLVNLSVESLEAMRRQLTASAVFELSSRDILALSRAKFGDSKPLRWSRDRIGVGLLIALRTGRRIEFFDDVIPVEELKIKSSHLVVCEMGESLSEVIAANYAFALNADLYLIDPVNKIHADELIEALYSIGELNQSPSEIRTYVNGELRRLCGNICLPDHGSLTFITRQLPFGMGFPAIPATHLFSYPDLGISIINGFAAEQKGQRGSNVAVLVDPGRVAAPEIDAAAKLLPTRGFFVRDYRQPSATVREVTDLVERFPYDVLIFATHCGDVPGYRWTYEFRDTEGLDRRLVVDIAIGVADTDDQERVRVTQYMRYISLDGVDWNDPIAKKDLHVGSAINDFMMLVNDGEFAPTLREDVTRVYGSAAMAMADNNYLPMMRSLAAESTPIVINNACVSWHELASRFMFADARVYIGTLFSVADAEAEAVVTRLLGKHMSKTLAHAVWSTQNEVYGFGGDRRPYIVTGVYPQRLRSTQENVPAWIMNRIQDRLRTWKKRLEQIDMANGDRSREIGAIVAYYEREASDFHERWFSHEGRASRMRRGGVR